jgi:putative endonuclease
MKKGGAVYIMTNKNKTTLYIGVTSDLYNRILQHKEHYFPKSFTTKYNLTYCIYYESFFSIEEAIMREKMLKKLRREKKEQLINRLNPAWRDLWEDIKEW